jgi:pantetheine-phosphate adenylyltransferase
MFSHAVVGGTFDHLHTGHISLLTKAYAVGKQVTIGLTSDRYVSRIKKRSVSSYQTRIRELKMWLEKHGVFGRTTIVPIDDSYGPSNTSGDYEAIVVSQETKQVAKIINTMRIKKGISPLSIIVVPMVPAEDLDRISSTRIRNGEIDHEGKLMLPELLRKTLTKPIGTLIPDGVSVLAYLKDTCCISVGDTTTAALVSQGITPTLAIIDFQARRIPFHWEKPLWDMLTAHRLVEAYTSGPGYIQRDVMEAIARWQKTTCPSLFIIDGEEDLLVLPAILYSPLGSVVFYGQPEKGIIRVKVTKKKKRDVWQILSQFVPHS